MNRRDALGTISLGGASILAGVHPGYAQAVAGVAPIKIRDVKTILTAPNRIRLVIVKVETSEPGLYGVGDGNHAERVAIIAANIDEFLKPMIVGRNADEIEDIWQTAFVSTYWRSAVDANNAMAAKLKARLHAAPGGRRIVIRVAPPGSGAPHREVQVNRLTVTFSAIGQPQRITAPAHAIPVYGRG